MKHEITTTDGEYVTIDIFGMPATTFAINNMFDMMEFISRIEKYQDIDDDHEILTIIFGMMKDAFYGSKFMVKPEP
jgi:hypothetical protein